MHLPREVLKAEAEIIEIKREMERPVSKIDPVRIALANARPDGSHCTQKACVFPALLEGLCRQHYVDAHAERSLNPSPHDTNLRRHLI